VKKIIVIYFVFFKMILMTIQMYNFYTNSSTVYKFIYNKK